MPWLVEGSCPDEVRKRLEGLLDQVDLKERLIEQLWIVIHFEAARYRLSIRRVE